MHWMQNNDHESTNPILMLLLGTRDPNSPLSLLRGLEDIVLKQVARFSVSPCHCCRDDDDGPVAFCCHRQKKMLMDRTKEPWPHHHWDGEVPDSVFMSDDHVLFYVEGLPAFHCCSGWCSNTGAASGMYSARGHGSLVVTDAGFYYYPDELKFISWNDSSHVIFTTSQFHCPGALEV